MAAYTTIEYNNSYTTRKYKTCFPQTSDKFIYKRRQIQCKHINLIHELFSAGNI